MALAIAGDLCFNPLTDTLTNERGEQVKLDAPVGETLPDKGFTVDDNGYVAPAADGKNLEVSIAPDSKRLQKLAPFAAWDGKDLTDMPLLIKTQVNVLLIIFRWQDRGSVSVDTWKIFPIIC